VPDDLGSTTIGRGVDEENVKPSSPHAGPVSNGFVRGQNSKFRVLDNDARGAERGSGQSGQGSGNAPKASGAGVVASISPAKTSGISAGTAAALRRELIPEPTGYAANLPHPEEARMPNTGAHSSPLRGEDGLRSRPGEGVSSAAHHPHPEERAQRVSKDDKAAQAAVARMKGYEGEACGECGNFTMVRNGTCLKCDTCGGTSGCS
jgi:ribonucleoside-diphosphate reductase alpha chain